MSDDYKRMLHKARKDLAVALQQKTELDARVVNLRQAIFALSALSGEPLQPEDKAEIDALMDDMQGITNGIRRVLSKASGAMTAPEIRDSLLAKMEHKQVIEGYANPLSVIHNTLARLERQGEVKKTDDGWVLIPKQTEVSRDHRG